MARGGKRPGAGRPLGKRSAHQKLAQDTARTVLAEVDTTALWKKFLYSPQVKVAADCLQYLYDRAYGRPSQTIQGGSQPVRIEFSLAGWASNPEWLSPVPAQVPQIMESRVIEENL